MNWRLGLFGRSVPKEKCATVSFKKVFKLQNNAGERVETPIGTQKTHQSKESRERKRIES